MFYSTDPVTNLVFRMFRLDRPLTRPMDSRLVAPNLEAHSPHVTVVMNSGAYPELLFVNLTRQKDLVSGTSHRHFGTNSCTSHCNGRVEAAWNNQVM